MGSWARFRTFAILLPMCVENEEGAVLAISMELLLEMRLQHCKARQKSA